MKTLNLHNLLDTHALAEAVASGTHFLAPRPPSAPVRVVIADLVLTLRVEPV